MGKLLSKLPWWVDLLLPAIVIAALWVAKTGYDRHQQQIGADRVHAEWDADTVARQHAEILDHQAVEAETQRRISAMQEIVNDATTQKNAALADADRARTERDRLRNQQSRYLAAVHAASPASDPTSAIGGPSAAVAADLLADLFGESDEGAGSLAAALDSARAAGLACERAYDALTAH